jgi:hypothetical protein
MSDKPKRHLYPHEIEHHAKEFDSRPASILVEYLQSFDQDGRQVLEVPPHILEALAKRFRALMGDEPLHKSIDGAFGGRIRRQLKAIDSEHLNAAMGFAIAVAKSEMRGTPREGAGTPFELAVARVAKDTGVNEETVRRRYKDTKSG